MRKIRTQEDIEKDKKRKNKIFTFVMLGILLFSSLGYAFFSNPFIGTNNNSNEPIQNVGGQWAVRFGDQIHYLATSQEEATKIDVNVQTTLASYAGETVYIDSENQGIYGQIATNLAPYVSRIQPACYMNCTRNLPEKECDEKMIVWRDGENRVYQKDNCVFIEGDIKSADAFIYKLLGVN